MVEKPQTGKACVGYIGPNGEPRSNDAELRVITPETPPRLEKRAARMLLKILLTAHRQRNETDEPPSGEDGP